MKALVTGGAGCIGSDLAAALLARGDQVVVIDNLSSGRLEHLAPLRGNPNFSFIEGDLEDAALVVSVMNGIDLVWHLAANPEVKFSIGDATDKDLRQNIICTYNVLEAMRRRGVKRLAFSSTSTVYGISPVQPIPESAPSPQPISLYGATKQGCEALISAFQNLFGWQCWIFRFANIVGPKVRKKGRTVIGDFIMRLRENPRRLTILGNGEQAKSYLLSEECIDAMLFIVGHAGEPLNVYNVGCDGSLRVTRIADMVVEALGLKNVEYQFTGGGEGGWPGDVPRFELDTRKLNELGWRARRNSEEAVRIAIEQMLAQIAVVVAEEACKP
jgi:UDP-glucose 4-epimerase